MSEQWFGTLNPKFLWRRTFERIAKNFGKVRNTSPIKLQSLKHCGLSPDRNMQGDQRTRSRPEIDLGMLECALTGISHRRAREEGISAPQSPGKDLQSIKSTSKSIRKGPTVKMEMAVDLGRRARGKHTGASEIMRKCSTSPCCGVQVGTRRRDRLSSPGWQMTGACVTRCFTWPRLCGGQFGHIYEKYSSAHPITRQTRLWPSVLQKVTCAHMKPGAVWILLCLK